MGIHEREEALFSEWREIRPDFVPDGAVDEEAYLNSAPKILFLLKEVNGGKEDGWDLRHFLGVEGGRPQTWDNVTRWVEGIRRLADDISWSEFKDVTEERRRSALRTIAAVNLKKSPGGSTTDDAELARIAEQDKVFLNRQFPLYDADVTICCGTAVRYTFDSIVDLDAPRKWRITTHGIEYCEYRPGKYIVAFAHPEARVADCLLYYGLVDALRQIRGTTPW